MYVLAVGFVMASQPYAELTMEPSKITNISHDPDRLSMWMCEVMDAQLELTRTR